MTELVRTNGRVICIEIADREEGFYNENTAYRS